MSNTEDTAAKHNRRNRLLGILAAVVVVGIVGYVLFIGSFMRAISKARTTLMSAAISSR